MTREKNPRLGIIGAGSIVRPHIEAAYQAGLMPVSICGKSFSSKAEQIAREFSDMQFCETLDSLLETDIDAILIAVPPEESLAVLKNAISRGIPILIEKPVALTSTFLRELSNIDSSKVIVGFNRRHYSSVAAFKSKALKLKEGLIKIDLPELSWMSNSDENQRRQMLIENSIHVLDLINFIFGSIEPSNVIKVCDSHGTKYAILTFKTILGFVGSINLAYGTPENISMKVWGEGLNLELSPLEIYTEYNRILPISPSFEIPFKRYVKQSSENWKIGMKDLKCKPGFIEQFLELKKLITGDSDHLISARLEDAEKALLIAEMLI